MAIYGTVSATGTPANIGHAMGAVFVLFGLPFIAIGFFMLAAPYLAAQGATKTAYAVTNLRALTVTADKGIQIKSFYARDMSAVESNRNASGFCDLKFSYKQDSDGDVVPDGMFIGIKDAAACERSLRALSRNGSD